MKCLCGGSCSAKNVPAAMCAGLSSLSPSAAAHYRSPDCFLSLQLNSAAVPWSKPANSAALQADIHVHITHVHAHTHARTQAVVQVKVKNQTTLCTFCSLSLSFPLSTPILHQIPWLGDSFHSAAVCQLPS